MRRKIGRALLLLCCLVLVAGVVLYKLYGFRTTLTRGGVGIATQPPPQRAVRPQLTSLPRYDPDSTDPRQVELQGRDLRALDLRERLPDLLQASFDNRTQWPAQLPTSFDPARIMEMGKNPGLGVHALHRKGVTGKGVSIAIIDMSLLVDHAEYGDRLRLYEELHRLERNASMHGAAAASIAVGKTMGVAPEADLYYISDTWITSNPLPWAGILSRMVLARVHPSQEKSQPAMGWEMVDFRWLAKGIRRVLAINRDLPAARKIRVISVEVGWTPGKRGYEEVTAAVEQARKEGVFVISSSVSETHGLRFHGLGREPLNDPDDPASYHLVTAWGPGLDKPTLLIPMDSRTTAAATGAGDYAFYREGGWSWVTTYLAGLYALACQVKPDVTPELFWEKALETGTIPDYSKVPPVSRESVRKEQADWLDAALAKAKSSKDAEDLRRGIMTRYRVVTGKAAPKMSSTEFRDWTIKWLTDAAMERREGREGRIVNPVKLMEALQQ